MFHMNEPAATLLLYLLCTRWHFYISYVDCCTHTPPPWRRVLRQLFPLSSTIFISIDIYHKNANQAELTVKTEHTAVSVKAARKLQISAELTAPVSHPGPVQRLWRQRPQKTQSSTVGPNKYNKHLVDSILVRPRFFNEPSLLQLLSCFYSSVHHSRLL